MDILANSNLGASVGLVILTLCRFPEFQFHEDVAGRVELIPHNYHFFLFYAISISTKKNPEVKGLSPRRNNNLFEPLARLVGRV